MFAENVLTLCERSNQCTWIRYEDLVKYPKDSMEQLLNFLELDIALYSSTVLETVHRASVDKWRDDLDDSSKKILDDSTDSYLKRFGYI